MSDYNSNIKIADLCEFSNYKDSWDANAYLQTYYAAGIPDSLAANFFPVNVIKILDQHAEKLQKKQRVLEFGGGPCLWPSFLLAPYFDEVWFCDYVPSNLQCVQDWLDEKYNAHDWKPYFNSLLDIKEGHHKNVADYKAQLRSALRKGKIFQCDVHNTNLLSLDECESSHRFDMIFSKGCLEAACSTYDMFKQTIRRLGDLLKPDGILLLLTFRNASFYAFKDHKFTDLPINEEFIQTAFAEAGLFTKPICISTDLQTDFIVEDNDGLMITYTYRKNV